MGIFDEELRRRRPRPPTYQTLISRRVGKWIAAGIIAGGAALFGLNKDKTASAKKSVPAAVQVSNQDENFQVLNLMSKKQKSVFTEAKNVKVIKLMRQDNRGAAHQRFIVQFPTGETLRAIYNLDLSEKVPVSLGDTVNLGGELDYDSRTREPFMHWLHEDPIKKHTDGYVLHNGKKYGVITKP